MIDSNARQHAQSDLRIVVNPVVTSSGLIRIKSPCKFRFPLIQQRPVNGAGSKIGHMLISRQTVNRSLELSSILAEDRTMTGEEPFHVRITNPFQRMNEGGNI